MTSDTMPDDLRQALITVIGGSPNAFREASKTLAHWNVWTREQRQTHLRVIVSAAGVLLPSTSDAAQYRQAVATVADHASR